MQQVKRNSKDFSWSKLVSKFHPMSSENLIKVNSYKCPSVVYKFESILKFATESCWQLAVSCTSIMQVVLTIPSSEVESLRSFVNQSDR